MQISIASYNVNGIRSAMQKGLMEWLQTQNFDIICLQEIKANAEQINTELLKQVGFEYQYWFSAQKKGYSGTAILSKQPAKHIEYGCNHALYDYEGRVIRADFGHFSVMSVYMPSGSSGEARQDVKMQFLNDFERYIGNLQEQIPNLIIAGDFNICHYPIDIHDPISNKNSTGFLPEERQWLTNFFENQQFIDSFRYFYPQLAHHYTWWSFRANARHNNKGWRIDYIITANFLKSQLCDSKIFMDIKFSDHCPIVVYLNDIF